MVDLSVEWLGLELKSPFVVGASPISDNIDAVRQAVEAGAGAVVMRSLFEEQLTLEQLSAHRHIDSHVDLGAEARSFLPESQVFSMGAEPYLRRLEKIRAQVPVPVLASLNGVTSGGWTSYAKSLESAGAYAIELNLYDPAPGLAESSADVEERQLAVVASVVQTVKLPVSVKLSPFYAALPSFVRRLEQVGARGVVLFNRYYQPDIDLDQLDVDLHLVLSTPTELPLRLHALAMLSPHTALSLACSGGVHRGRDAAKAILSGAHVVQLASVLLARGPGVIRGLVDELSAWLVEKGYPSVSESRAVLSHAGTPDPQRWERLNYFKVLDGWRG
ncbi:MAG: dihydroorotate dehydrogenase-like protein [Myxococcota bacterium]